TIPKPCPFGPTCPSRAGQCEVNANGVCRCVPILPSPAPTPTPQCTGATCGGACTLVAEPPCEDPEMCKEPEEAVLAGQCQIGTSGGCECVPMLPSPSPTPTPQCTGATCGGPCILSAKIPCPDPEMCNEPEEAALAGQCQTDMSGVCQCVPILPSPQPTPTPQCAGATCGGPCTIRVPCPPGVEGPHLAR